MGEHVVRESETIQSIARQYGLLPETIWEHENNAALRQLRESPNQLFAGDRVFIPEREEGEEDTETESLHTFRSPGRQALLKIRFLREDEPRADARYIFTCEGIIAEGRLDGEGKMEERVPAEAEEAVIRIGEPPDQARYQILIGRLDPIDQTEGVQERLNNLGFCCGEPDSEIGTVMRAALSAFQEKEELQETGELDDQTRQRLLERHDWE